MRENGAYLYPDFKHYLVSFQALKRSVNFPLHFPPWSQSIVFSIEKIWVSLSVYAKAQLEMAMMHYIVPRNGKLFLPGRWPGSWYLRAWEATPARQPIFVCRDVACGAASRRGGSCRYMRTTLPLPSLMFPTWQCTEHWPCKNHVSITHNWVAKRDYSLLKLDFSSWKQVFLIWDGRGQMILKFAGKFCLEQRTKMFLGGCRCLSCHSLTKSGLSL